MERFGCDELLQAVKFKKGIGYPLGVMGLPPSKKAPWWTRIARGYLGRCPARLEHGVQLPWDHPRHPLSSRDMVDERLRPQQVGFVPAVTSIPRPSWTRGGELQDADAGEDALLGVAPPLKKACSRLWLLCKSLGLNRTFIGLSEMLQLLRAKGSADTGQGPEKCRHEDESDSPRHVGQSSAALAVSTRSLKDLGPFPKPPLSPSKLPVFRKCSLPKFLFVVCFVFMRPKASFISDLQ